MKILPLEMSSTSDIEGDRILFEMSTIEIQKEHADEATEERKKKRLNREGLAKCPGNKSEDKKETRLQQLKYINKDDEPMRQREREKLGC